MFGRERRRLRAIFEKVSTPDLARRAHDWPYLERYAEDSCVSELREMIAARRFVDIKKRWRKIARALFSIGEGSAGAHPEFVDSGTDVALRAMIDVLANRQESGTLSILEGEGGELSAADEDNARAPDR